LFVKSKTFRQFFTSAAIGLLLCGGAQPVWAASAATTTTLAITSGGDAVTTVASGSVVTLTTTVTAGATPVTVGQVNFCEADAAYCTDIHLLDTAQLTNAGTATFKFRPGLGSHSYKAVFAGTATDAGSSSSAKALTVTGTIPSLATAATINQTGSWGAYTLLATLTETGNTAPPTGTVSFLDTNNGNAVLGTGTLGSATRGVAWTNVNTSAPNLAGISYAVADLNGDGIPDLFVKDYFDTYDVFLGNGDGTFAQKGSAFGPNSETGSFILGDFNNDGIPDVASIDANYYASNTTITIFLGNGDGTFTVAGTSPAIGYSPSAIATADINGDGNADLIVVQQGSSTSPGAQVVIFYGNGDGTFTQASSTTSLASVASSIIPADLNGDGHVDLVLTGVGASGITILLGKGDGTFTSVAGPSQAGEATAAVADVNNDGFPDLVFGAADTSYLTVFLGNGDGTFTQAPPGPNGNVVVGNSVVIADLNQDGIPDIVYSNESTTGILFGKGDGTFVQFPATLTFDTSGLGTAFVVADFNGDGWPDVLAIDGSGRTIAVALTQPTEAATASATVSIAAAGQHLVDASYPGDSNYNSSASGTVSLWGMPPATTTTLTLNSGGTQVTSVAPGSVVTLTATVRVGANPLTVGQMNFCDASASQCTDIHLLGTVALTGSGTATYKFVPGPGVHSYKAVFVQNGYGLSSSSNVATLTVGPAPNPVYSDTTAISVGGYAGDYSLTATVVGYGGSAPPTGNVSFLDTSFGNTSLASASLGTSTAGVGWLISQTPAVSNSTISEIAGDFNGDGIPDLAILWNQSGDVAGAVGNAVTIFLGKGDGTFTTGPTTQAQIAGQTFTYMIAGDFNGDGKMDLVLLNFSFGTNISIVTTFLGNGDGTFTVSPTSTVFNQDSDGGDYIPGTMIAADFNGDGKLDLAVVGDYISWGGITILLGNGDGTFAAAGPNLDLNADFGLIATGDFNGDGIPDLIATNYFGPGGATVFLGKGDGTFTATATPLALDPFISSIVVGDFNGDGKPDLAFGDRDSNVVSVFLGNGDGTFNLASGSPISGAGLSLIAGDFNHDGKLDLAGIDNYNDLIDVFLGSGDGTFQLTVATPVVSQQFIGPFAIVAADFNEDGVPDLAMLTNNVDTASILLTEPTQTATATVNNIAPVGAGTHNVEASYPGDSNYPSSVSGTVALTAGLAPLVISPAAGIYTTAQTITISESVPGASILYSASGPVNTNGFVPYAGPIQLTEGGVETIQAYATETGYLQANTATVTFRINMPAAPAPVFSPPAGNYSGTQTVTISDSVPGSTIYYTTGGTIPGATTYTGPITVSSSETLTATAISSGYSSSTIASAQYLIDSSSTSLIYTIAGDGLAGYTGDAGPATTADLQYPAAAVKDSAGNLYIADSGNNVIRKVAAGTGVITTFAGTGTAGYSGDNGAATSAQLNYPAALVFDGSGNLYIADEINNVVRKVTANTGVISTIAGTGTAGFGGDSGSATSAELYSPVGIALDSSGNLYVADTGNERIRKVAAGTGIITTVAGSGAYGYGGDGGPATSATFFGPYGIAVDSVGNLYIADTFDNIIREVNAATGIITTVAGYAKNQYDNPGGYSGDGGPATSAQLYDPYAVTVDSAGNLYIADTENSVIRKVTASNGIINTIAGNGNLCYALSGDGGAATSAELCAPECVSLDISGDLIIPDSGWNRIREVITGAPPSEAAAEPAFSVAAGTYAIMQTVTITDATPGAAIYVTLDGTTPTTLSPIYNGPIGVSGSVIIRAIALAPGFLASAPATAEYTITAPPTAVITTVAGNGVYGFSGAGGPATGAELGISYATSFSSQGIVLDSSGNLYIADSGNGVVWMVAANTGIISIVAGTGTGSYSGGQPPLGDGSPATSADLNSPSGLAIDSAGNLYISDPYNNVVRKVTASTGVITTVAGNRLGNNSGSPSQWGDGGPATSATLDEPAGLAVDSAGNLYIADYAHGEVRKVTASTGIITTVAGNGTYGATTNGVAATSTSVVYPSSLAFDSAGNLYIAHVGLVRKVAANTGIITTVAGGGGFGVNSGDGGLAVNANLQPGGIALDAAGNLYIASWPDEIREISASTGIITKVAGDGYPTYSGDGGVATVAGLNYPTGIVLDASGNIYFGDVYNNRVRKVTFSGLAVAPEFSPAPGAYITAQTVTLSDATPGASIYYTTDGTTPTANSSAYSGSISVSATEALQAIAVAPGYTASGVATAVYTIGVAAPPTIIVTPSASSITSAQALTVTVAVSGGSTNPVPTGSVTLTGGGYASTAVNLSYGSASISVPAGSLAVGSDTLKVTYVPDASSTGKYLTATQSATETVTAISGTATATVTATVSAATITNDQSVTVNISVAGGSGEATPTGTVTLTSGSYSSQQPLSGGTASFDIAAGMLSSGANVLTASYSGDATYASASVTATVTVSAVTIAIPAPSPVPPGGSATATVTFTAGGNYSGTLNMTCTLTSSPTGAQSVPTCALNPSSVTIAAGGSGTTTLTVNTTAASTSALLHPLQQNLWGLGGGGTLLAVVIFFGVPSRRRRWISMVVLFAVAASTIGCGGGGGQSTGSSAPATTAGNYVFTLTGTDSANAKVTVSTTVSITVQ
jgi:hypothetical protein